MAKKLSLIASSMLAGAAGVGSACSPTVTTAEIQDLTRLLTALATRNDLLQPAQKLVYSGTNKEILPG